ncbi:hypothetical protein HDU91_000450, partial [Kappamyces sp. JEL0680]
DCTTAVSYLHASDIRVVLYFGQSTEYRQLITAAKAGGMYGTGYSWIGTDALSALVINNPDPIFFAGTIFFFPLEKQGAQGDVFDTCTSPRLTLDYSEQRSSITQYAQTNVTDTLPNSYTYFQSSCVDLLLLGFDRLLKSNSSYTVDQLISGALNSKIKYPDTFSFPDASTPSGKVVLDSNGDRVGDFALYNFDAYGNQNLSGIWTNGALVGVSAFNYPGNTATAPKDRTDPNDVAIYATSDSADGLFAVILAVLGVFVSLVTLAGYVLQSKHTVVKSSSFRIGVLQLLCIAVAFCEFALMVDKPTSRSCAIDSFLLPVTFSFYYSLTYMKGLRIYLIFNSPMGSRNGVLSDWKIMAYACLLTLPTVLICIIWNGLSPVAPAHVATSSTSWYWTCASARSVVGSGSVAALLVWNAILLVMNLVLAVKSSSITSTYNESKLIGLAVYNTCVALVFVLAILLSTGLSFSLKHYVKIIGVSYILGFNLVTGFILKVVFAYQNPSTGNTRRDQNSSVSGIPSSPVSPGAKRNERFQNDIVSVKPMGGIKGVLGETTFRFIIPKSTEFFILSGIRKKDLEARAQESSHSTGFTLDNVRKFKTTWNGVRCSIEIDQWKAQLTFPSDESASKWRSYFDVWNRRVTNLDEESFETTNELKSPPTSLLRSNGSIGPRVIGSAVQASGTKSKATD